MFRNAGKNPQRRFPDSLRLEPGFLRKEAASLRAQLRRLWPTLLGVYAPVALLLGGLTALCQVTGVETAYLLRDPVQLLDVPFYIGLCSNLGILIWWTAAGICFFSAFLLRPLGRWASFLLWSGVFTAWLVLDDFFILHEIVIPDYLGIRQRYFLAVYAPLILLYLLWFGPIIRRTDYLILSLALGFFGLSMFFDAAHGHISLPGYYLFEDGCKLAGIVSWTVYFIRTAMYQILKARPFLASRGAQEMPPILKSEKTLL